MTVKITSEHTDIAPVTIEIRKCAVCTLLRKMLLKKLSGTVFSVLLPKFNSISILVRWKSFTHSEGLFTRADWEFRRKVLKNTDGCILYDPSINYNPSEKFIENDETIWNFIQFSQSCELNKNGENRMKELKILLRAFDRKCLQSSRAWTIDKILFILDIWDSFHPFRSNFSFVTPAHCLKYLKEIPNGQKLQLLHYLAYSKVSINEANQWLIIQILDQNLTNLSIEEASFYYSALVRCECQASEKYASEMKRCINHLKRRELRDENQLAVSSALKAIRKLTTESHIEDLKALQRRLVPLIKRANIFQLTHYAQLGLPQRVFNPKLLELVIERSLYFIRNAPNDIRTKDVERILLVIATYRLKTPNGFKDEFCKEVQPLLKASLDTFFSLSLIQCIASLATIGVVDHTLIDWALNYGENTNISISEARHFLLIDSFAKLNLKDSYNGHILSDETCSKLESKAETEINDGFHLNMQKDLLTIFKMNNHHVTVIKTVPHFIQPDLVFIYNTQTHKTVEFVQPNKYGSIVYASELYNNNEPNLVAIAIVTYGKTSTLHSISSCAVIGRLQMKMDQLKLLGFHMVPWNVNITQWNQADFLGKQQLLRNRLWIEQIQLFDGKNDGKDNCDTHFVIQ